MSYEALIKMIESRKCIFVDKVYTVLTQLFASAEEANKNEEYADEAETQEKIDHLIGLFLSDIRHTGTADGYHNCAIELARNDDFPNACCVLERGIARFPANVDLLSDYLQYGIQCDALDKCMAHYETLLKIGMHAWNWRAFDFSIDYFVATFEQTTDEKKRTEIANEIMQLVEKMFEYLPKSEHSYFAKANFCPWPSLRGQA